MIKCVGEVFNSDSSITDRAGIRTVEKTIYRDNTNPPGTYIFIVNSCMVFAWSRDTQKILANAANSKIAFNIRLRFRGYLKNPVIAASVCEITQKAINSVNK